MARSRKSKKFKVGDSIVVKKYAGRDGYCPCCNNLATSWRCKKCPAFNGEVVTVSYVVPYGYRVWHRNLQCASGYSPRIEYNMILPPYHWKKL